jgi:hypothetical protein
MSASTTPRSSTRTLIKALAIMAKEDRSEDGIAGAALLEASQRLQEMATFVASCATNYDCDDDAHRYNTQCRVCDAWKLIGGKGIDQGSPVA